MLAQFISRTPRSCQVLRGSSRAPLRKDGGFDHGHDQQAADESSVRSQPDASPSASRKLCHDQAGRESSDSALSNENQFRDVAQQLQHSILQINQTSLDMVALQGCAELPRLENEQVAREQGAQDCETGRDEHLERKGGWNSRSEATGAARDGQLGGAQDLQQGLEMVTFASSDWMRRWTCSVRPARARERTRTRSTRHADRSINSSLSASKGAH